MNHCTVTVKCYTTSFGTQWSTFIKIFGVDQQIPFSDSRSNLTFFYGPTIFENLTNGLIRNAFRTYTALCGPPLITLKNIYKMISETGTSCCAWDAEKNSELKTKRNAETKFLMTLLQDTNRLKIVPLNVIYTYLKWSGQSIYFPSLNLW